MVMKGDNRSSDYSSHECCSDCAVLAFLVVSSEQGNRIPMSLSQYNAFPYSF